MWDLILGFSIAVAGALNGHQQQMPRDVHDIPACEAKGNESCAAKEFEATVDGRPGVQRRKAAPKEEAKQ